MYHTLDLVGNLIRPHKDMGIILGKAAHPEQSMEGTPELMPVYQAQFSHPQGQFPIAVGLGAVDHDAAGAVHGLDAVVLPVDLGGVHVVLVVIPVAGSLPQMPVHNQGRGHLHIALPGVDLPPVVDEGIFDGHALGQEERETGALVTEHKQAHLLAQTTVIPLLRLFHQMEIFLQLRLIPEGDTVDPGEHLVVFIVLPVGAGLLGNLEGLEGLGIGEVGTYAHVDIVPLLVKGDDCVLRQIADMLHLVDLSPALHQCNGLLPGQGIGLNGQILLADLLHLLLNGRQILIGELLLPQIHVVIESTLGGGSVGELGLGMQPQNGLGHDMGCRVADYMELFLLGNLPYMSVIVDNLHIFSAPFQI